MQRQLYLLVGPGPRPVGAVGQLLCRGTGLSMPAAQCSWQLVRADQHAVRVADDHHDRRFYAGSLRGLLPRHDLQHDDHDQRLRRRLQVELEHRVQCLVQCLGPVRRRMPVQRTAA